MSVVKAKTNKKYRPLTVGSFEKEYGVRLGANAQMYLSTHMKQTGLPGMGKLLSEVEKNLSK